MRRKKRTVSETETHRVVTLRGGSMRRVCRACGQDVEMLDTGGAAAALGISVAALHDRLANNKGHCTEVNGVLWVCSAWLSQSPR